MDDGNWSIILADAGTQKQNCGSCTQWYFKHNRRVEYEFRGHSLEFRNFYMSSEGDFLFRRWLLDRPFSALVFEDPGSLVRNREVAPCYLISTHKDKQT